MPSAYQRKMAEAKKPKKDEGEIGTKASGFADNGPYSCMSCIHKKHVKNTDVCTHPTVNADPELEGNPREGDFLVVGYDECCRFVRPPAEGAEEE